MGEREVEQIIEQWRQRAQVAGEPADDEPAGRRPWPWRRILLIGAAAVAAVVLAAGVAAAVAGLDAGPGAPGERAGSPPDEPQPSRAPAPETPAADDWFSIMRGVDASRAAAYERADARLLEEAFDVDGSALAMERGRIAALQESGRRAVGWSTELLAVAAVTVADDRAELRVRDRRGSYRLVADEGRSATVAAAEPGDWRVELVRRDDRWLVHAVERSTTSQPGRP